MCSNRVHTELHKKGKAGYITEAACTGCTLSLWVFMEPIHQPISENQYGTSSDVRTILDGIPDSRLHKSQGATFGPNIPGINWFIKHPFGFKNGQWTKKWWKN